MLARLFNSDKLDKVWIIMGKFDKVAHLMIQKKLLMKTYNLTKIFVNITYIIKRFSLN